MDSVAEEVDAVVVGAGFAGLYALYKLRGQGLSVKVFEAADDVGGTWYWNKYPGARCDVESMHYSYSFDPALEQEWEWTEKYAGQPEILSYLRHVADRYDLRKDVVFETRVTRASFDEGTARWHVRTDRGHVVSARYCVMAVGCLSVPKFPEVPGLEAFTGPWYHTGTWPEGGVDFTGQRVGVIGTGSSGIQAIPLIAEQAAELTVFQRTPNFSFAAFNGPLDPDRVADVKANYREVREADRNSIFGIAVEWPTKSALEVSESERRAVYQERWNRGHLNGLVQSFTDLIFVEEANETAAEFVREQVRGKVDDPETARKLEPRGYPFSTKRPCLDTGYYETYNREHVHLVDLREEDLVEITATGVRTTAGEYEFDSLVLATGFDAMTGAFLAVDITGRNGLSLREKWHDGPVTYLGLAVSGFPNLFTVTGPGSPSVLSNMVVSIEQHVDWIGDLVEHMARNGHAAVEATETAEKEWTEHVREVSEATLFPRADSYYLGANVTGKPRVFMPYVGGVAPYRQKCDSVAESGYSGFDLR
ncbi:flavin-containing monooxygenase [Saccharothrix longispora]|uniref:Cation diffusion facilitator CzcD-associated flavoprotein CzcO n=1 Tax=Saccharothrix longispora TaxID=33920 RepID=A0ABU1PUA6_9PSEU|nr:NAD(P)/FAD-dependent oxidoreductase [Saccharothrix longispora]MDR6594235.1 cation diffusion facilitator CzcD-associated flavoprotein CzcO [Saccharothrix longispora]